jgi:Protein of unknown function (DUF3179)
VLRGALRLPLLLAATAAAALGGCLGGEDERTRVQPVRLEQLASGLGGHPVRVSPAALERVVEREDRRFIAPLIELLQAGQVGLADRGTHARVIAALERLSGHRLGSDWPGWVEWYESTPLGPPPGFRSWKGRLLSGIDDDFERFFDERHPSRIRIEEVVWGGVSVDSIPALDRPRTLPARRARYLEPDDPVFGVELNGDARAYPLRILDWHEMVNDVVGRVPVSLAYCTLCGAGVLFDTRTRGRTYTFGSSGLLMRSNKLMYDRPTRTLWNQLTGEPVLGPLARRRIRLRQRPLVTTTWRRWRRLHPHSRVLDIRTGHQRVYENGAAYADYFASDDVLFPARDPGRGLEPKERVLALRMGDAAKAYPLARVLPRRVVNDRLAGRAVVIAASSRPVVTRGVDLASGLAASYGTGAEVRAFARGAHRFRPAGADAVVDERGRRWRVTEEALMGPGGERLERLPAHLAYAFGWLAFFPHTEIFGGVGK